MADKKKPKIYKDIGDVLKDFTDKLGEKAVCTLADTETHVPVEVFSTGCLALDQITGKGGIPRGRATEVWGQEGGGKSTLMYSTVAQLVKSGGSCMYIDMEHKLEHEYMYDCIRANGVEPVGVYVVKPPSGTDALNIVKASLDKVDLIVIDSIPALVTKAELSASDAEDQFWAMTARLITQNIKQIIPLAGLTRTALVGINQARDSQEAHGSPFRTMGGRAWKHAASLRIWVRRVGALVQGPNGPVGINCKATVQKNAIGIPDLSTEFEILWDLGVDPIADLVTVAPDLGVMDKNGGHHYYKFDRETRKPLEEGGFYINGEGGVKTHLRDNPELADQVRAEVITAIKARKEGESTE